LKSLKISVILTTIIVAIFLCSGFVVALSQDEVSAHAYFSSETLQAGQTATVNIFFSSTSADSLQITYASIHFDWLPTGAVYGFCQMLLRIDREHRPTHLCVVFDAPGKTFRDDLFKDYKANRPPTPPELIAQIDLAHQAAAAFGYTVLSISGVEADDVIATLVRNAGAEGLAVVIGSSDKDLMQLCAPEVQLLDAMKNRLMGPSDVKEKWGVLPDKLGDVLLVVNNGNQFVHLISWLCRAPRRICPAVYAQVVAGPYSHDKYS